MKNVLDYVCEVWNDKVVGIVSYGLVGGVCVVEYFCGIFGELLVVDVCVYLVFFLFIDFDNGIFKLVDLYLINFNGMLD